MIELTLKNYLAQMLADVPVKLEIPADPPAEFILIEHTGGGDEGELLQGAVFAVQSYGPSLADAAALNKRVETAMRSIAELPQICSCALNSSYNFTDTASKHYRYQAVYDIIFYREE